MTENLVNTLFNLSFLNKFFVTSISIILFFVIKSYVDKKVDALLNLILDKDKRTAIESAIKAIWIILLFILVVFILQYWGINITPLLAGLGVGSIIVGLALQNTLSNFFSGVFLTADRSIRIGDFIELPQYKIIGTIEEIDWRCTRIRTIENNIVNIPNSILANSLVINYSQPLDELNVWVEVGVSYFDDLDKVEKVTLEVAREVQKEVEGAVKEWEPKIFYTKFGDSNIYFYVILRARDFYSSYRVRHEFIKRLKKRFDQEGIEISFPNVNVFMRYGKENYKIFSDKKQ